MLSVMSDLGLLNVNSSPEAHDSFPENSEIAPYLSIQLPDLQRFSQETFKRLSFSFQDAVMQVVKGHPGEAELIRKIAQTTFGPLTLPYQVIDDVNQTSENKQLYRNLEASARIQQNLVHAIFYAGQEKSDIKFVEAVYMLVRALDTVCSSKTADAYKLNKWWSGVKAELATVKMLKKWGYKVLLPNYKTDSRGVFLWDVNGGIDLVIEPQSTVENYILCLDSKNDNEKCRREGFKMDPIFEETPSSSSYRKLDSSVKTALHGRTNRTIYRTTLWLGCGQFASRLDINQANHRQVLKDFLCYDPQIEKAIMNQLQEEIQRRKKIILH